MAMKLMLHPSYLDSPTIDALPMDARLHLPRIMLGVSDAYGCFPIRCREILGKCYPNETAWPGVTESAISEWLEAYQSAGLLQVWSDDSRTYGFWRSWDKFNRVDSRYGRTTPEPPDYTGPNPYQRGPTLRNSPHLSASHDSLRSGSGSGSGSGSQSQSGSVSVQPEKCAATGDAAGLAPLPAGVDLDGQATDAAARALIRRCRSHFEATHHETAPAASPADTAGIRELLNQVEADDVFQTWEWFSRTRRKRETLTFRVFIAYFQDHAEHAIAEHQRRVNQEAAS